MNRKNMEKTKFPKKRNHRKAGKRGYRLHDERIAYSSGEGSMRSIKYELIDPSNVNGLRDKIADAISSDNKWLYGNINLNDYLEWRKDRTDEQIKNGDREKSFLGFWLKALSLGFVFSKQSHAQNDFADTVLKNLFENIKDNQKKFLDKERWCKWAKTGTPKTFDPENLKKQVYRLIKNNENYKELAPKNNTDKTKYINELPEVIKEIAERYSKNKSDKFGIWKDKKDGIIKKPDDSNFPKSQGLDDDGVLLGGAKNVNWNCDPDFIEKTEKNPTKLLDEIIKYYNQKFSIIENKKDDKTSNWMALYSPKQGYMAGFLGNFFTFIKQGNFGSEKDEKTYLGQLKKFFSYSDKQIEIIKNRLENLKEYSKDIPTKPLIESSWANYNSFFGGLLESWYSNRASKLKNIPEQLTALYKYLEEIENVLSAELEERQLIIDIKSMISDYRSSFEKPDNIVFSWKGEVSEKQKDENGKIKSIKIKKTFYVKKLADREFTEKLELYLADLRSKLNDYNQLNKVEVKNKKESIGILDSKLNKGDKDENGKNKNGWQEKLSKKIQSAPLFFGENKREFWEETYTLKILIKTEIDNLIKIINSKKAGLNAIEIEYLDLEEKDNSGGNKTVNVLARTYSRFFEDGYDGNSEIKTALENIARELGADFSKYDNHTNKGAGRFYLSGKEKQDFNLIKFEKSLTVSKLLEVSKLKELLEKAKTKFNNKNYLRDLIALSKTVGAVCLQNADKREQIELSYIHSKLSGFVSVISKQEFIARYSVQATNGGQSLLGVCDDVSKRGDKIERYFYAFKKADDSLGAKTNFIKLIEVNAHNPEDLTDSGDYLGLKVASSQYQIQFLDWFFGKHTKKKTKLQVGGAFSITEKTIDVNWDKEHPETTQKDTRVFVSQPFTIIPKEKAELDERVIKNSFIGVDIGEYGLAWSLISVVGNNVTQEENGFIADKQQQALKKAVNDWRKNQARQTFTTADTYIARLRESLIGSYKNQLESLALSKNARLSFEYEVSGFEVGGNRVKKIYDSIKRGIVRRDENKPQNKQSFGDKPEDMDKDIWAKIWGIETTAAGTSQFCTKCQKWASLAIDKSKKDDYELENYNDKLFKVELSNGYVRLLGKREMQQGDEIKGKDLKSLIYKAMRPNEDGLGMEIVKRQKDWNKISQDFGENKKYGNMAIFVCPYTDCHHITHADKQAAFNIAVRGYLKDKYKKEELKKSEKQGFFNKEFLTQEESKLKFEPIGLL